MRPARIDDMKAAVDLFNACSLDQIGKEEHTLEDLQQEWRDLAQSTRVIESGDGRLMAYIEVWDTAPVPVTPWVWGRVHPQFEGLGLGTALLTWAEERARQAIERVPDGVRVAMRSGCISTHQPSKQLLSGFGMELVRHFYQMVVELDQEPSTPIWPEGLRLITYEDLPDLAAIYRATTEAFLDHWGFVEQPVEEGVEHWRHRFINNNKFDPTLWFLAMAGDEIAGFCLCRKEAYEDPDMGYVTILGVRRPWRRRGLGMALLQHAFAEFYHRGQKRAGLGVDAGSLTGATRLYERAGMHVARQFDTYEKMLRPGEDISTKAI